MPKVKAAEKVEKAPKPEDLGKKVDIQYLYYACVGFSILLVLVLVMK